MARPALEVLWQEDTTALVFTRTPDGKIGPPPSSAGRPATLRLAADQPGVPVRRFEAHELLALADSPPLSLDVGGTAAVAFAVLDRARCAVDEGLVHPQLEPSSEGWHAFWGATLDVTTDGELAQLADALPKVAADVFGGDADAAVRDLYACAVDTIARDRLVAKRIRLGGDLLGRTSAVTHLLTALTADDPQLPQATGYTGLERMLTTWVDSGLSARPRAPWALALHLDERLGEDDDGRHTVLELWLQAADDPTLGLPASLLWQGGADIFTFLRAGDPERALVRQLERIEPVLAEAGVAFADARPFSTALEPDQVADFLRTAVPALEEHGVPILLPGEWLRETSRLRVNVSASSPGLGHSSGLLGTAAVAAFEWKLAIGDVELSEEELAELAAAKEPLLRAGGRWHMVRRDDIERALGFIAARQNDSGSLVDLVRAISGVAAYEAGLELGAVSLDPALSLLLGGDEDARFEPIPAPDGMTEPLYPFQERGHGWLRLLSDRGIGAILADDMGLGKTVQAIAMFVSERAAGAEVGPTLVVCPMSVTRQWVRELERFAPALRTHLHHGPTRLHGERLLAAIGESDVVVTSYDLATRDVETLGALTWHRVLLDEAQDAKNPNTKRARALRLIPARSRVAMTGTPIENRLQELWAIMDVVNPGLLGTRDRFEKTFARPIEIHGDARALDRLRTMVRPFILRRGKEAPEVGLDLPAITVTKQYCTLTVEQAGLYQATIDRWLPRIAEHERAFDRRGAVLAMIGQLKQVCNHPETVLTTGRALGGRSGKLDRMVELIRQTPRDDRTLVFTQYPGFGQLAPYLEERLGRRVGFFHGGLLARARDELVAAFHEQDGPELLVVSLKAGGRGLNLPVANHVFHFDRWWNPAVEQQATDRVHRLGQQKPVFVHTLITQGTVEERIDELLEAKRELAEKVVEARPDDWLAELDLEELRAAVSLADTAYEEVA
ncbi:MAG: DEAD/DEAH box helicase [Gaiella sp.]